MKPNEKSRRNRRTHRIVSLFAMTGVVATSMIFSISQAAIPPKQDFQFCIHGKELVNFGLTCNEQNDCYTDYKVHFTATISGENVGDWEDTVRVEGGRSWYGYNYSSCTDTSCTESSSGGVPENVPSQSNANAALQEFCMAPKCNDDLVEVCAQLSRAAQLVDPLWKSSKDMFESKRQELSKALSAASEALCPGRKNEQTIGELTDIVATLEAIEYTDKDKYNRVFKVEDRIKALDKSLKCPGTVPAKPAATSVPSSGGCPKNFTPAGPALVLLEDGARETIKSSPGTGAARLAQRFIDDELGGLRKSKVMKCMPRDMTAAVNACRANSSNCNAFCIKLKSWGIAAGTAMDLAGEKENAEAARALSSNCLGMTFP